MLNVAQHRFGSSAIYDTIIFNFNKNIIQLEAKKRMLDNRLNLLLTIPALIAPIASKKHLLGYLLCYVVALYCIVLYCTVLLCFYFLI